MHVAMNFLRYIFLEINLQNISEIMYSFKSYLIYFMEFS
jgi:hypothetical protein